MFFLLKSHHHQIVSNRSLLETLTNLQQVTKNQLKSRQVCFFFLIICFLIIYLFQFLLQIE